MDGDTARKLSLQNEDDRSRNSDRKSLGFLLFIEDGKPFNAGGISSQIQFREKIPSPAQESGPVVNDRQVDCNGEMRSLRAYIVFISCLISLAALAENAPDNAQTCSTVKLADSPGLGAPSNRDGTGWCYAYSAADLISFKLKQQVSPMSVTMTNTDVSKHSLMSWITYDNSEPISHRGGYVEDALKAVNKKGVLCSENELPSDYSNNDLYKYLKAVEGLQSADDKTVACRDIRKPFPNLLAQEMKDIINSYHGDERLIQLAKASCKHPVQVPPLNFQTTSLKNDPTLSGLDDQLDHHNIVSFSHDINFFFAGPQYNPKKMTYDHQATIVGRQFVNGKCLYEVKGSSGREFNYKYASPYKETNAGGYVWVDKQSIEKFSESYTYVE